MTTYQDYCAAEDKAAFLIRTIERYIASDVYANAVEADCYYRGENPSITGRISELSVEGRKIDLTAAIRTPSGIFKRLITQLCQSIWAYGVQMESADMKNRLGRNFDKITESISKKAAVHGVSYGFWNFDRLQQFTALEYFPLKDERTGEDMAGVRFWRIAGDKPMFVQFFELDGWTEFKRINGGGTLEVVQPKQAYTLSVRKDALSSEIISQENYGTLPIIPMYANEERMSELTKPIKSKIDLSDFILSGFGDSIMRTKAVYWLLQGFSGQVDDLQGILREVEKLGIIAPADNSAVSAQTVELPFAAVQFALDKLERDIYLDFMGLQVSEITGGSLTNVAIQTAQYNLMLKVSDFEWQALQFVQKILALQNIHTENIKFKRKSATNDLETMQMLMLCRDDFDLRTALEKNPLVDPDEVELILERQRAEVPS